MYAVIHWRMIDLKHQRISVMQPSIRRPKKIGDRVDSSVDVSVVQGVCNVPSFSSLQLPDSSDMAEFCR